MTTMEEPALGVGPGDTAWASGFDDDHTAVIEQAKGVLIYRFATDCATAEQMLGEWAAEAGVTVAAVAQTLVHEICRGRPCPHAATWLVRWVEDRMRR